MIEPNNIKIYDYGKIDIHNRKHGFEKALNQLKANEEIDEDNKNSILDFIRDCMLGKTVKGKSKKKIGMATCLKYVHLLKIIAKHFSKPFNEINLSDMENFIQKLESDGMAAKSGKPFSDSTKVGIKKTIKKFWKWKDGNNRIYPELVEWIDTCIAVKDVPALRREEVERMLECTPSPRNKALIMVLFDSGARIEELLNVRLKPEHLFWKSELGCYMIRLEYSKTKPRTISLPLSTKCINNWLDVHPAKSNPQAQLFPLEYNNIRAIISRIGKRSLNKQITPHMLRHSSATFYANKIKNPYKLCYRYGWAMSSDQVNRYLDREGIFEEETPNIIKNNDLSQMHDVNLKLREDLALSKESYSDLSFKYDRLKEEHDALFDGKNIMRMVMTLAKQQKVMAEVLEQASGKKFDFIPWDEN